MYHNMSSTDKSKEIQEDNKPAPSRRMETSPNEAYNSLHEKQNLKH